MSKTVHQAYKFQLQPTEQQKECFRQFAGARRWVYNQMLEERSVCYRHTGSSPSMTDQMKRLTAIKNNVEGLQWLKAVHSQVLQQAIRDLDDAFEHFFNDGHGYPSYKSKYQEHQTFRYPQNVSVEEGKVRLPRIGWVKMRQSRRVVGTVGQTTVKREGGRWYACINTKVKVDEPCSNPNQPVVGIDLGLNDFAVLSDGQRVSHPRLYRQHERKLSKEQRKLSRKEKGSHRYRKQKRRVARCHQKVRNRRRDFLHKLSTRLVDENQAIVVEDLSVSGLARTNLAKSVHDSGWNEFVRMLQYKGKRRGCEVIIIDRFFPSTRQCRHCGHLNTVELRDRTYECESCSETLDRDLNAAKNIRQKGIEMWSSAGQAGTETARRAPTAAPPESAA